MDNRPAITAISTIHLHLSHTWGRVHVGVRDVMVIIAWTDEGTLLSFIQAILGQTNIR